jgi:hypothetical protein
VCLLDPNGSIVEVTIDISTADAIVLPDPDGRELCGFDQTVNGHVGNPHHGGDFTNG